MTRAKFTPSAAARRYGCGSSAPLGPPSAAKTGRCGSFAAGQPLIVGEQGPELFVPASAGEVLPNDLSEELVAGGGNAPIAVHNHFNIDARGATPGVEQLIEAKIEAAFPKLVQATMGMILRDNQRGGAFARMKRI